MYSTHVIYNGIIATENDGKNYGTFATENAESGPLKPFSYINKDS